MRNNYLFLSLAVGILLGILFFKPFIVKNTGSYIPREPVRNAYPTSAKDAALWLQQRRANLRTGKIDIKDINKARNEAYQIQQKKGASLAGLTWEEMGPDNVGGRTRALIVDKNNSNVLYAGSVSGGLWKSISSGQYWTQIDYTMSDGSIGNYAISSMCQASNGHIYFGTGEGFYYNSGAGTGGLEGAGIWKSTDGVTFTHLSNTWNSEEVMDAFVNVNELAVNPSDPNNVFAATRKGLWQTTDGGQSWSKVIISSLDSYSAQDVKISSEGTVIVSLANTAYVRTPGSTSFVKVSGNDEDDAEGGNLISLTDISRMEFAFAPSNPNYVYCSTSDSEEALRNIYLSTDKGLTWSIIGRGGSSLFNPFGQQGSYDQAITVHPQREGEVFVAGLNVWRGKQINGGGFEWLQISESTLFDLHPMYVHADQHVIVFDSNDSNILYIGSDGGVSRGTYAYSIYMFNVRNNGYNVTQFYSVGYTPDGRVLGGTQDNGTQYFDYSGNTLLSSYQIIGGDGGFALGSQLSPDVLFGSLYFSGVQRSNDRGNEMRDIWFNTVGVNFHGWVTAGGGWQMLRNEGAFVTPFALWETANDPYGTDTVGIKAMKVYTPGLYQLPSFNSYGNLINVTLQDTVQKDDSIKYYDPYSTVMAIGAARMVWITRKACNFNKAYTAWDMLPATTRKKNSADNIGILFQDNVNGNHEDVEQIAISCDGKHVFFATNYGIVYRISNIHLLRKRSQGTYTETLFGTINTNAVTTTQIIARFDQRAITEVVAHPTDPSKLIVTLGNYGEESYVYYSENADVTTSQSVSENFKSIQGDLPHAPVYSALFNTTDGYIFVGNEFGVYSTQNIGVENPSWVSENNKDQSTHLDPVPVFQLRQQTMDHQAYPYVRNQGVIYAATHGRGLYKSRTFGTGIFDNPEGKMKPDSKLKIYPNPAEDYTFLAFENISGSAKLYIYDLSGKIMKMDEVTLQGNGLNHFRIELNGLKAGTYLVKVQSGSQNLSSKLFVK